ncbi:Peroxisome biosynthesis protein pex1 [Coemansia aciculifera]|nr:Peroxisome biosynthesis protein pex1 [Coemansia aciculifera]
MSQTLVVAFRPLRSCLVNLPARWVSALAAQPASKGCMAFQISWGQSSRGTAYVGWSGGVSHISGHRDHTGALNSDVLEIDSAFGRQLGLADGTSVRVEYVADVGTCTAAEVEPASADDWEILSLNAGAVEERLLQQARVVAVGQPIVFWLSASTVVRLNTASVTPKRHSCCLLANDSEVIVAPRTRHKPASTPGDSAKQDLAATSRRNVVCCMRVAADETGADGVVYANPESSVIQHMAGNTQRNVRIGRATPRESADTGADTTSDSTETPKYADLTTVRLEASDGVQPGVLLASPAMLRAAGLSVGETVRIQPGSAAAGTIAPIAGSKAEEEVLEAGVGAFVSEAWQSVDAALAAGGSGGGLLVCGRRGSGKSSVVRALARRAVAAQGTRLVYARHVDCAALGLEPRTGQVVAALRAAVREARASAPALLVLDDVDALVEAASEHGDERRARRLAEALVDALVGAGGVAVLATAAARSSVHARVLGAGVFAAVREIPAPRAAERELMLAAIAHASAAKPAPGASFAAAAYATEGYAPADLRALYARAAHEAAVRAVAHGAETVDVTGGDLGRALVGFQPLALRGVAVQTSTTRWADIGGLVDTRRQLRETLELPARYAAVFASSPLRLRSGVLLYGFPGCGKTLLASAVARECGLSFVATKGPELLSKYIGSSEQAVRDLFRRAAAAAPCVLFFDEFDAIAPRRGHDNTGVTDRVVNQFLTEMDGAEGLAGVYVLAATSRPDLIDPALLRPGRLDKAFLCPLPASEDRADILRRHAARLRTAELIDWPALAARAEHFSGADLQALVYNAFLAAVHEMNAARAVPPSQADSSTTTAATLSAEFAAIGEGARLAPAERAKLAERMICLLHSNRQSAAASSASANANANAIEGPAVPIVTTAHFEAAFATTHASLAANDRERFASIYRAFVNDKKASIDRPKQPPPIEQRATLA